MSPGLAQDIQKDVRSRLCEEWALVGQAGVRQAIKAYLEDIVKFIGIRAQFLGKGCPQASSVSAPPKLKQRSSLQM